MPEDTWVRVPEQWVDIAGETVVLIEGSLTRLDAAASMAWRLLDKPARERDLATVISRISGADKAVVARELSALLLQLLELGIVRRVSR